MMEEEEEEYNLPNTKTVSNENDNYSDWNCIPIEELHKSNTFYKNHSEFSRM